MIVSEEKKWWQELAEAATNPSLATFLRELALALENGPTILFPALENPCVQ